LETIRDSPYEIFALSTVLLWASIWIGRAVGYWTHRGKQEKDDLSVLTTTSLTLLALVIAFSFSIAAGRYDQRKNYEEEEANAIGTEYLRAGLLRATEAVQLRRLLTDYLSQRLLFYTTEDAGRLHRIDGETAALQNSMWSVVQAAAAQRPTPPTALVVSGMNDVINRQGYTQSAWWYRIPLGAWYMMLALAVCCGFLVGVGATSHDLLLFTGLPLIIAVTFLLISDIDSPRGGVIRVQPQNLISLSQSLGK
jgi:hypothetical protein